MIDPVRPMSLSTSITNGLAAAFDMARGRTDWAERMDMSPEAVFRSFWALPLAVPGMLLSVESTRRLAESQGVQMMPRGIMLVDSLLSSLVIWVLVVVFYLQLARVLKVGWRISPVLIVNNYSTFLGYSLLGIGMGVASMLGSFRFAGNVWPMVMVLGLWLDWGMLRRGMGMKIDMAFVTIVFVQIAALVVSGVLSLLLSTVFAALGLIDIR